MLHRTETSAVKVGVVSLPIKQLRTWNGPSQSECRCGQSSDNVSAKNGTDHQYHS